MLCDKPYTYEVWATSNHLLPDEFNRFLAVGKSFAIVLYYSLFDGQSVFYWDILPFHCCVL